MNLADLAEGYAVGKRLSSNGRTSVHQATRESDGLEVLLKVYHDPRTGLEAARSEFEALRACRHERIPEAVELFPGEPPVLVVRRAPGWRLGRWVRKQRPTLDQLIGVAIGLADVLEVVHEAHVVHRNITPRKILVDPETHRAHLIDFDIAIPFGAPSAEAPSRPADFAGTPLYLAPEQTGWVSHGCDSRTDLYGLGATLYHVLTGEPPFCESDPNKLLHAQVAREPRPPHEVRPEVPVALSSVVLRLLRKEPGDRYPDAASLRADLQMLRDELARNGRLNDAFQPCVHTTPQRPRFGSELYGRDRELARLRELCRHPEPGAPRIVFLRGTAGSGKTALMNALRPTIADAGGYLAVGECGPRGDAPYAAWSSALRVIVSQILRESPTSFRQWQETLSQHLGTVAGALTELVPDLSLILSDVSPPLVLDTPRARERLALAFERMICACASRARPLIVLLDDLQWSDAGGLFLLRRLLHAADLEGLVVIGSLRPEDLGPDHALQKLIDDLAHSAVPHEILEIGPLEPEDVRRMLADVLGASEEEVLPLVTRVCRTTDSTPLLIRELVERLHERGLLSYRDGHWTWDMGAIEAAPLPDGAAAWMATKIEQLPEASRGILELASCMGSEFDLAALTELSDSDTGQLISMLHDLTGSGLLIPSPGGFRFAHDRIRAASRACAAPASRARWHVRIGRWLLDRHPDASHTERVFEIADHLNRSGDALPEALRLTRIEVNARAGRRALHSGAGDSAAEYLQAAHRAFRPEDWNDRHALGLDLHIDWAASLIHIGELDRALILLDHLDHRPTSRIELARVAVQRIHLYALTRPADESVRYALRVLRSLGIRWPLHPSSVRARSALWAVRLRIGRHNLEEILRPEDAPDPDRLAPLLLFDAAGALMSRVDLRLVALMTATGMRLFLRHGYPVSPVTALAALSLTVHAVLRDSAYALRIGESALRLVESTPDPMRGPRAELQIRGVLHPWHNRRRSALVPLERVARQLHEAGDCEWHQYALLMHASYRALAGDRLADVEQELEDVFDRLRRWGSPGPNSSYMLRVIRILSRHGVSPEELENEAREYARAASTESAAADPVLRTMWLLALTVYRRFDLAFAQSEAVVHRLRHQAHHVHVADHTFYRGLAASQLASVSRGRVRWRARRAFRRCRRHLHRWAAHGPDFRHMALLLDAEHARQREQSTAALRLYRDAAIQATDQSFPHHVALTQEQRGRHLMQIGRTQEACQILQDAADLYEAWGARAKSAALRKERDELYKRFPPRRSRT